MQPAVENGSINDLRPVDTKNRTRTVTPQDKTAWDKQIHERVGQWPAEVWIREVANEATERMYGQERSSVKKS